MIITCPICQTDEHTFESCWHMVEIRKTWPYWLNVQMSDLDIWSIEELRAKKRAVDTSIELASTSVKAIEFGGMNKP